MLTHLKYIHVPKIKTSSPGAYIIVYSVNIIYIKIIFLNIQFHSCQSKLNGNPPHTILYHGDPFTYCMHYWYLPILYYTLYLQLKTSCYYYNNKHERYMWITLRDYTITLENDLFVRR